MTNNFYERLGDMKYVVEAVANHTRALDGTYVKNPKIPSSLERNLEREAHLAVIKYLKIN